MKEQWSNVPGKFFTNVDSEDDNFFDDEGNPFPPALLPLISDGDALIIEFYSSGYYDSGSMYGGPDRLGWPPEGGDERVLKRAYIEKKDSVVHLNNEISQILFDHYEEQINKVQIEWHEIDR